MLHNIRKTNNSKFELKRVKKLKRSTNITICANMCTLYSILQKYDFQ